VIAPTGPLLEVLRWLLSDGRLAEGLSVVESKTPPSSAPEAAGKPTEAVSLNAVRSRLAKVPFFRSDKILRSSPAFTPR
jgi:hypothetical protein